MELEEAQIMFKLTAKNNWGEKYDRLEHFKRFPNLKKCIKKLSQTNWITIKHKPDYIGISLNPHHKKVIIEFIETQIPHLNGYIK